MSLITSACSVATGDRTNVPSIGTFGADRQRIILTTVNRITDSVTPAFAIVGTGWIWCVILITAACSVATGDRTDVFCIGTFGAQWQWIILTTVNWITDSVSPAFAIVGTGWIRGMCLITVACSVATGYGTDVFRIGTFGADWFGIIGTAGLERLNCSLKLGINCRRARIRGNTITLINEVNACLT